MSHTGPEASQEFSNPDGVFDLPQRGESAQHEYNGMNDDVQMKLSGYMRI